MLVYISFLLELQACISPIIFKPNILLLKYSYFDIVENPCVQKYNIDIRVLSIKIYY